MKLRGIVLRNITSEWIRQVVTILSGLFITPVLIGYFAKYEYGLWVAVGQGTALLMLLDFGIANSVSRFVARSLALKDEEGVCRIFNAALLIFIIAAIIVLITTAILLPFIPDILGVDRDHRAVASFLFGLLGLNVVLVFPLRIARGLLQAKNRFDIISKQQLIGSIVRLVFILLVFGRGHGDLKLLGIMTFGINLLVEGSLFISVFRFYKKLSFNPWRVSAHHFTDLFSLGFSSLVQTFSGVVHQKGNNLAVTIIAGVSATPLFYVPYSILQMVNPFINRLGSTFVPIASGYDAQGDKTQLRYLTFLGVRYELALSIPIAIFFFFYGEAFLNIWLGRSGLSSDDIRQMSVVLKIMIVPFAIGSAHMTSRSILMATGKHWITALVSLFAAVTSVLTTIILLTYMKQGVNGAAIGWGVRLVIMNIIIFPVLICRHVNLPFMKLMQRSYKQPITGAVILVGLSLIMNSILTVSTLWQLALVSLIYVSVAASIVLFIVLLPEHKHYLITTGLQFFKKTDR